MNFPITFEIVGIRHYYSKDMPLSFEGYLKPEPTNIHDSKAIAVYSAEGRIIGHIPKSETDIVRAWAKSDNPILPCKIYLQISEDYNIYMGCVSITPRIDLSNTDDTFKGKNIYVYGGASQPTICSMIDMLGETRVSHLSKTTDYVIYNDTIPKSIKEKESDEGYHFSAISFNEFIKMSIPESEKDTRIFGKVVSPATTRDSLLSKYLEAYILFNGGTYRPRYNKSLTDVVVQWDDTPTQVVEKAVIDNKEIVKCSDLLPDLYEVLSRTQNTAAITEKNTAEEQTIKRNCGVNIDKIFDDIINKHSTPQREITSEQKTPNNASYSVPSQKQNTGNSASYYITCIVLVICLFAGFKWYKNHQEDQYNYQYNNVETVDYYYLLSYTPPRERYDKFFGRNSYTDPKVKIEPIKESYESEEDAFKGQMDELTHRSEYLNEYYDKTLAELKEKPNDIKVTTMMEAIINMLHEEHFLVRLTHVRSFDPEEALKMIKEHWRDGELEEYAEKNKLDYSIQRLYI